ncbi:hypothetical protein [Emticicia sp. BO119]|uniref:hypothetical protein n=1 Tax=Emticicia sp. BO119 TaxID=2757768 RepID=UPI00183178CC|nr:hypothetical protein [Emticicia sp. BO119]MBA4848993.1 hypothetical protein [Emticicia sp. BO119]
MPNLETFPEKYFPTFARMVEILNDKGRKYEATMCSAYYKTWIYIHMPTTYESIPCDNFVFRRGRLYQEAEYKEVITALNYYIDNQEKGILG